MRNLMRLVCAGVAALSLCFLHGGWAKADTVTVAVGNSCGEKVFDPAEVTINTGDTVCWTWVTNFHSTTSDDGLWESGVHNTPYQFEFTFDTADDYFYHCSVHQCLGMRGIVHVVDARSARAYVKPLGIAGAALGAGALGLLGYGWRRRKRA